jgi:thioredoxin 2
MSVVRCPSCDTKNRVPPAAPGTPRCGRCHADLPWVVDADDGSFAAVADGARLPVLVDLWAPWCGPCRAVSPALERLATERAGQVKLVKVNVDQAPTVASRFEARSIPTLVVLDHGQPVARQVGAMPLDALRSWLDQALPQRAESGGG